MWAGVLAGNKKERSKVGNSAEKTPSASSLLILKHCP